MINILINESLEPIDVEGFHVAVIGE